jgi:hypothetical protein
MSTTLDPQPTDPPRIGPYRLVGVLGSGGMGRVYLGRSPGGMQVAVKMIRAEVAAEPHFRARFAREVAAARRVNGLYTAVVVDADPDAPQPWLATTYINAPSLADLIAQHGPLSSRELRSLAAGLAEGLASIHAAGLVHRDLKPSNVLVTPDGPKIIDFGIALATDLSSLTGSNTIVGSPGYMSPEQAQAGHEVGPASDIFSLGAMLCYAATGRTPWGDGSQLAMLFRVVHEEPELTGVTGEMHALAERCLAKDPTRRPAATDILAEFGEPEPGHRPEPPAGPPGPGPADESTVSAPMPGPVHRPSRGGLLAFGMALLFAAAIWVRIPNGVGRFIFGLAGSVAGDGAFAIPLVFALIGWRSFRHQGRNSAGPPRRMGWAALLAGTLGLLHIAGGLPTLSHASGGWPAVRAAGGLIGMLAAWPLDKLATPWVAIPVLGLLAGYGVLVLAGLSAHEVPQRVREFKALFDYPLEEWKFEDTDGEWRRTERSDPGR